MKKIKLFMTGAVSFVIFGFFLMQPIQAAFVTFDSPIKYFFYMHQVLLCLAYGFLQGIIEEGGCYLVFRNITKSDENCDVPFWFGLGRSTFYTALEFITIFIMFNNGWDICVAIVARIVGFGALVQLTKVDYVAYYEKAPKYLIHGMMLRFVFNAFMYAFKLGIVEVVPGFQSWFVILYSLIVYCMGITFCPRSRYMKIEENDD